MKGSCQEFEENYPDCTDCTSGKQITVQENKRKHILKNPSCKPVCKVRVDDCVISSVGQRKCDYLLIACQSDAWYFVELKGKDLLGAVEQLTQTLEHFQAQIPGKVFARTVLTKVNVPKTIETDARIIKLRKLLNKYRGDFKYGSRQYENDQI